MFYLLLIIFMLMGGVLTVITIENLMTPVHLMLLHGRRLLSLWAW